MNARFWFSAGVLTGVTAAAVFYAAFRAAPALDRTSTAETHTAPNAAVSTTPAPSMEAATAGLEARLERNGGSAGDWELLAKSYDFLERPEAAARARQHLTAAGGSAKDGNAMRAGMPSVADVAALSAAPPAGTQERGR